MWGRCSKRPALPGCEPQKSESSSDIYLYLRYIMGRKRGPVFSFLLEIQSQEYQDGETSLPLAAVWMRNLEQVLDPTYVFDDL